MKTKKQLMGLISRYYSIWRTNNAAYEEWAKQHGLSFNSVMVLYSLHEETDYCTQKTISLKWSIPKQTVNMVLKDFEKKGYVTLEPMQDDRRNKQIIPTLTGKAYATRIISELHELEMSVLCDFGEERLSHMADDLELFTNLFLAKSEQEKNGYV